MKLSELFERVLAADYRQVGEAADYALEREGAMLYIYFQQSRGCADWENNLDFPAKPYGRMDDGCWLAHRGFSRVWQSVEPYLAPAVADRRLEKICIAGYSHGAALAVFCHEYVWYHRPDLRGPMEGYGFGCPRVVWGILSKELQARWARFTVVRNLNDVVTRLPPAFLGYRHIGRMLEIGKRGVYSDTDAHRAENILKELKKGGY